MFRNRNQLVRATPRDGQQVLLRARVSLYEGRGEFQLVVDHLEDAGAGLLQRRFEELKQRLAGEFKAEIAALSPEEQAELGQLLRSGLLPVPNDLNQLLLAAFDAR